MSTDITGITNDHDNDYDWGADGPLLAVALRRADGSAAVYDGSGVGVMVVTRDGASIPFDGEQPGERDHLPRL